jgi:cell wall-associated NlpC family hydrolase
MAPTMTSTTTTATTELWRIGIPSESYAFEAPRPGDRDLGELEFWERSKVRSQLRRESAAARKVGVKAGARSKLAMALVGVTLAVPATEAVTAGTAQAAPVTDSILKRGDSGSRVAALQRALGIAADGEFGTATHKAVRAFQRANGLTVDGVVGAMTASKLGLGSGTSKASKSGSGKAKTRSTGSSRVSDPGLSSATVKAIQAKLGIGADGEWGPQTRKALRAYQAANGLEVDGVPGPATLASLGVTAKSGSGSGSAGGDAGASEAATGSGLSAAISAARSKTGAPYSYGATGPSSFDCSGLTQWAFKQAGISLPRTSFAQYGQGTSVSKSNIQAGDLVFFDTNGPGASHVGIATSSSTVISATSHGVMEHSFTSGYWSQNYVGAKRVS